jgi:hypothetical protein
MTHFNIINELPILDLETELNNMLYDNILNWSKEGQICLNCTKPKSYDYYEGCGSLGLVWSNSRKVIDNNGNEKLIVPDKKSSVGEKDFKHLCMVFNGTFFEDVYQSITEQFDVGRVRLMKSSPKTCLSWHIDYHKRIHFPLKTQEGCFMVIEDEVKHLDKGHWWETNTQVMHTAVNASKEDRIHLVATVLAKKD